MSSKVVLRVSFVHKYQINGTDDEKTDWYEVHMSTEDDKNWAYPGESIKVYAAARHLYYDEYGYLHFDENPSGIVSGLSVLDSRIPQKDNQLWHDSMINPKCHQSKES